MFRTIGEIDRRPDHEPDREPHPRQHEADGDIQDRINHERAEDTDRQVAARLLGFLGGGGDRIEPDIGKNTTAAPRTTPDQP